jgi:urea-proton symporter
MSTDAVAPLPQGAGYGVVVGLGLVFALGTVSEAEPPFPKILTMCRYDMGYESHEKVLPRRKPLHRVCYIPWLRQSELLELTATSFMVANRRVGVGLTEAAVIFSWLYSTALLGASLLTYRYGVALGVWWGASASTMVCFLSLISIEAKRRAPNAHTYLNSSKQAMEPSHMCCGLYSAWSTTSSFSRACFSERALPLRP